MWLGVFPHAAHSRYIIWDPLFKHQIPYSSIRTTLSAAALATEPIRLKVRWVQAIHHTCQTLPRSIGHLPKIDFCNHKSCFLHSGTKSLTKKDQISALLRRKMIKNAKIPNKKRSKCRFLHFRAIIVPLSTLRTQQVCDHSVIGCFPACCPFTLYDLGYPIQVSDPLFKYQN